MSIFTYLKQAFASHIRSTYSYNIDKFKLQSGLIEFANWKNPMVPPKKITDDEIAFYQKFIPSGSFSIDIGANVGDTTVPMGLAAGKDGLVLAFDPNPFVFDVLSVNAKLNKDKTNIVPVPFAVTETEGDFFYNSSEASFANGGISTSEKNRNGKYGLRNKIKGINLRNYLNQNYAQYIDKLSFIKVDVEGHDIDVLRSIKPLIMKYKPALVAECFLMSSSEERKALYDLVEGFGYELYYFEDFDINTSIIKLSRNDMDRWPNFNFYATPLA
ncbi:FkbM family methyltransferase [Spirosoma panaciterrae]|uniref:FkbM family methyltransferase n=1 Tax=Spirosoma panaciterrae TaxID=496058 RepID=UPI00035F6C5A|nr:FkbM family methyltransferase [Spirosoma panaciterrae]